MAVAFEVEGRRAALWPGAAPGCPLVVLNDNRDDGRVRDELAALGAPDHSLLVVGGLAWNHDLTPWDCPPLLEGGEPSTGGADEYLGLLLGGILPRARALLGGEPAFLALAGYSLAGLFALYAPYRCDAFARVASMSGSLWFPGFADYAREHDLQRTPERAYLSLGKKEARTRNRLLRGVRGDTEALAGRLSGTGVHATVVLPGWVRTNYHAAAGMRRPHLPGWAWTSPEQVAAEALAAVAAGRVQVTPKAIWKVAGWVLRHGPAWLPRRVAAGVRRGLDKQGAH